MMDAVSLLLGLLLGLGLADLWRRVQIKPS